MSKRNEHTARKITLQLIPIFLVFVLMFTACGAPATETVVVPETGKAETPAETEA